MTHKLATGQNVHTWLHAALALISKQVNILTTAHAVNTVQFKVNGTDQWSICLYTYYSSDCLWHTGLCTIGAK
jgi:hypothetical protein